MEKRLYEIERAKESCNVFLSEKFVGGFKNGNKIKALTEDGFLALSRMVEDFLEWWRQFWGFQVMSQDR